MLPAFDLSFKKPVLILPYPVSYSKLPNLYAVVEQEGSIKLVSRKGNPQSKKFAYLLKMKNKICSFGSEEGLLGLAFAPDYPRSRRMYIYYSLCSPRRTVLSRITVNPRPSPPSPKIKSIRDLRFGFKEEVLLKMPQPYSNHNGGMILFHPRDGYLYIGTGDGGSGGDPRKNGQKKSTLLGKILRIDVGVSRGYRIPKDNPFRNQKKVRPEIFAYGFRNPWRFSFDRSGRLLVGDVGQNKYEEIHIVRKGRNYGWNIMEGAHCYRAKKCKRRGLEIPEIEYSHREGQCVIGGHVYYGKAIPELRGRYIFGDTITGKIWYSNLRDRNHKVLLLDTKHYISSFGLDAKGETYVIDLLGGIYLLSK